MIKVLHIEDDPDIREIAEMALGLTGEFEILQAESGEVALTAVQGYQPDVILIDMMMPGLTGTETLQRIRQMDHLKDVPAIFMTARAQVSELEELRQHGAADIISKPFDPMGLADQIKAVLGA